MDYFDTYAAAYRPYKGGSWCYEDGCIYRGLGLLHAATGEERWFEHLKRLVNAQVSPEGRLSGYVAGEFNIDHILSGRALLYLHRLTGEDKYAAAARLLAGQLAEHPRTRSGVYWHKKIYPWQIWLDGLYMGLPFQIEFAGLTAEENLVEDALGQFHTALMLTRDAATGLYAHGFDESGKQQWADPRTGRSSAHWARALGWLAMALVDIVELIGAERAQGTGLAEDASVLLERIAALRTGRAMWLQVIDQPDLAGNYDETSATAMLAYALLKAGRLELLDGAAAFGRESLGALTEGALERTDDGALRLGGICHVAGLGGYSGTYRDGTAAYYLTEPVVADDPKGVGPLMMAKAEALRQTATVAAVEERADRALGSHA